MPWKSFRRHRKSKKTAGILTKKGKLPHMERQIIKLKTFVKAQAQRAYADFDSGALTGLTNSGTIFKLFKVPTSGTSVVSNRIGDEVRVYAMLVSITLQGSESNALLTADYYNLIGYKIGYSYKPDGVGLPSVTGVNGIFDQTVFGGGNLVDAPVGNDALNAVKVLIHRDATVAGLDTGSGGNTAPYSLVRDHVVHRRHLIKFRNPIKCDFASSSDAAASFNTFLPWIALISDSSVTPNPSYRVSCRVYYYM